MVLGSRRRGRNPTGRPNPIDVHVGQRIRLRRTLLGLSQEKLGAAIGLTFQQVQKYERGANRVGAARLYEIAHALDVPVTYFYDELDGAAARARQRAAGLAEEDSAPYEADRLMKRETLELVRAYYRIRDPKVRRRLLEMTKALAGPPERGGKKSG